MDIRILVALNFVVMAILFTLALRNKKQRSELKAAEGSYFKAIMEVKNNPDNPSLRQKAEECGNRFGLILGKSEGEIKQMLERDLA